MTTLWWARYFYLALLLLAAGGFAGLRLFRDDQTQVRRR